MDYSNEVCVMKVYKGANGVEVRKFQNGNGYSSEDYQALVQAHLRRTHLPEE